jgi:hypothetical protein
MIAHFSENWGFYTLLTELPTFMKGKTSVLRPWKEVPCMVGMMVLQPSTFPPAVFFYTNLGFFVTSLDYHHCQHCVDNG